LVIYFELPSQFIAGFLAIVRLDRVTNVVLVAEKAVGDGHLSEEFGWWSLAQTGGVPAGLWLGFKLWCRI
jgi:hypothetical protein